MSGYGIFLLVGFGSASDGAVSVPSMTSMLPSPLSYSVSSLFEKQEKHRQEEQMHDQKNERTEYRGER